MTAHTARPLAIHVPRPQRRSSRGQLARWTVLASFTCLPLAACSTPGTGTDTGNPHVDFTSSACKSVMSSEAEPLSLGVPGATPQASTPTPSTGFASRLAPPAIAGLHCVLAAPTDSGVRIEILNHTDGCHENEQWEVSSVQSESSLDLHLDNPSCLAAACGACIYDLSFEIDDFSAEEFDLRLYGDTCSGDAPLETEVHLELEADETTAICEYARYSTLTWRSICGSAFAPCGGASLDECHEPGTLCEEGLTCVEVATSEPRCLPTCEATSDCADIPGATCTEGTCRLPRL